MKEQKTTSELVKEAVIDANAVQELVLQNAKDYLVETFTPRIKNALKNKLKEEEDFEEPDEDEDEEDSEEEPEDEEDLDVESIIKELEDEDEDEEDFEEPDEDEDETELESIIKELEDEDEDEDDLEEPDEDEDEDELDVESIIKELEDGDEDEDDLEIEPDEDEDEESESIKYSLLDLENEELKKENKALKNAISLLRNKINEVNLLNAKIVYSRKLTDKHSLTEAQKEKIIEAMDRAKNLREVKMTYALLSETFNSIAGKKHLREGASGIQRRTGKIIQEDATVQRLQKLAGLS